MLEEEKKEETEEAKEHSNQKVVSQTQISWMEELEISCVAQPHSQPVNTVKHFAKPINLKILISNTIQQQCL